MLRRDDEVEGDMGRQQAGGGRARVDLWIGPVVDVRSVDPMWIPRGGQRRAPTILHLFSAASTNDQRRVRTGSVPATLRHKRGFGHPAGHLFVVVSNQVGIIN